MFTTLYAIDFLKETNPQLQPELNIFDEINAKNLFPDFKTTITQLINAMATVSIKKKNFSDLVKFGHNLEDILFDCKFNAIKCTAKNFTWSFNPYLGNCYTFNALQQSLIAGPLYGLQFHFYVNFHQNLSTFYAFGQNDFNTFNSYGAYIFISNSSYSTDTSFDGGIQITPGIHTNIAINRKFTFNLPKPYSNCNLDYDSPSSSQSVLIDLISKSSYLYTQQLCLKQCYQLQVIKDCNCTDPFCLSLFNTEYCNLKDSDFEATCVSNTKVKFFETYNFMNEHCFPLCPLECNNTEYKVRLSTLELYGDDYYAHLISSNDNLKTDFMGDESIIQAKALKSFVAINIYYDSLSYTISAESPQMTLVDLLANIGGNLSLFLGVSVFSLCELVEVFIEIYFLKKNRLNSI